MKSHPSLWRHGLRVFAWAWLLVFAGAASAQMPARDFDHLRTGFALTGAHAQAACESCHVGGLFKGTPRDCESCHVAGARLARHSVVKTASHIPTQQSCETCHNTRVFSGARMNHGGVLRGACTTCHNGVQASGKSAGHMATTASCDSCHGSNAWRPVNNFDHSGVAPGNCASCHNGSQATGKGASHTPYAQVTAIASASCDSCHRSGFRSWTPARLHGSVSVVGQCATCHVSNKPADALHAGQTVCETCHKGTTTWTGAKVDHNSFTAATVCSSCHNGSAASGKNATHIPTGATNCIGCHNVSTWKPTKFNHTQVPVTAQCANCHTGSYPPADGKGASHTPYPLVAAVAGANCDTCHKSGTTSWTPARLHQNTTVTTQCATCHTSNKPNDATHAGQTQCENCHKGTTTWTGAKVDHNSFTAATVCSSCHNGSGATGKNATHIPSGATNCISCHNVSTWKPTKFNHTQVPVTA
ncbi:MAG: cytochrome c3 family protein, partial [Rubrivivax sp.]|nr:cytochrome c3 family protein [Rubrivivax sp.]